MRQPPLFPEEERTAQGPPMGPPMPPPDMEMPPEAMGPPPGQMPEQAIPNTAKVEKIEGATVYLIDDTGKSRKIPLEHFIFPPEPGMELIKAEVVEIMEDIMVVMVEGQPIEVPAKPEFNQGDFVWMPIPPTAPEELHGSEPVL